MNTRNPCISPPAPPGPPQKPGCRPTVCPGKVRGWRSFLCVLPLGCRLVRFCRTHPPTLNVYSACSCDEAGSSGLRVGLWIPQGNVRTTNGRRALRRGSLTRNRAPIGLHSRTLPRALFCSWGGNLIRQAPARILRTLCRQNREHEQGPQSNGCVRPVNVRSTKKWCGRTLNCQGPLRMSTGDTLSRDTIPMPVPACLRVW